MQRNTQQATDGVDALWGMVGSDARIGIAPWLKRFGNGVERLLEYGLGA
jgi:hypothetical protein